MITVHYLNNSRAHRILWLLEELGQPYEVKTYKRGADMRAPESLKAVHPLGKSPVITDGDLTLAESGAITEYLLETYNGDALVPARGTPAHLSYRYWLHYAEGSAMPLLQTKFIFNILPERVPFFIRPFAKLISKGASDNLLDPQIRDHVATWERQLSKEGWFAGADFTAADIMMSFPVEVGVERIGYGTAAPVIDVYLAKIRARPAYQRAQEKAEAAGA